MTPTNPTEQKPQIAPTGTPRTSGKRRKKRLDPVYIALGAAVFLFFIAAVFFAVAYLREVRPTAVTTETESPLERENRSLHDALADVERELASLRDERDKLSEEISIFREAADVDGDFVTEMTTRLATLREKEAEYEAKIAQYRETIAALEGMNREDFSEKTTHIKRLMELLLKEAPMLPPKEDETERAQSDSTETSGTETEEVYPTIAIYY